MRHIISFFLVLSVLIANARQVTPDEAKMVATELFDKTPSRSGGVNLVRAIPQGGKSNEIAPYYIFNASDSQGFVIVAGDNKAQKILGYSDHGTIDLENLPPQLDWLLNEYANQINAITTTDVNKSWTNHLLNSDSRILLETAHWKQDYPFNKLCPTVEDQKLSLTGCTATAMAIVMRYHKHPSVGNGSHKYTPVGFANPMECNFAAINFDWDLMPQTLTNESSETEQDAVATLMRSAAISINSNFGSGVTGAYSYDVVGALRNHFDYDYSCQSLSKSNFTNEEWIDLIINELRQNRPIIYAGYAADNVTSGHTWVLDGYDGNLELFHFNWGWGGLSDGFFALSGGGDDLILYPSNQSMVINIFPAEQSYDDYSKLYVEYPHRSANFDSQQVGGLTVDCERIETGKSFTANINNIVIPPYTQTSISLALTDENNHIKELSSLYGIYSGNDRWIPMTVNMNCCFQSTVLPNDIVQVVEVPDENPENYISSAKFVTGTINAPSSVLVSGNSPNTVEIKFVCDDDIIIKLEKSPNLDGISSEYQNGDVLNVMPGVSYKFEIMPNHKKKDFGVVYKVYDCYRRFNQVFFTCFDSEKDEVFGEFKVSGNSTTFEAHYVPLVKNKYVELTTAGTLMDEIAEDELAAIQSMSISGNLNAQDIWNIGEYCQSLKELDLSGVTLKSSVNPTVPDFGDFIPSEQEENKLPEYSFYGMKRLRSIILPHSLEIIGTATLMACDLSALRIPENVNVVYAWLGNNNARLSAVYCESITPPIVYSTPLFSGTQCKNEGILYVPEQSIENYRAYPDVWNEFSQIKPEIKASSIEINPTEISANEGDKTQLTITFVPANASFRELKWTSSDPEVAIVDEIGAVELLKVGSATIKATIFDGSGKSAECLVTVSQVEVSAINLDKDELQLNVGETYTFNVDIVPDNATNKSITWSSSNPSVVSVTSDGIITANGIGSATILATTQDGSNLSASCVVTVSESKILISSMTIEPSNINGKVGETYQLIPKFTPDNATQKDVVWSSDNPSLASVDSNGLVTLLAKGNTIVRASTIDGSDIIATCNVVVDDSSNIQDIEVDSNQHVIVYDIHGHLVYDGIYSEMNLSPGIYIIRYDSHIVKRIVR